MPQLDISTFTPQIIWLIITFGVLYLLMAKLALPRIGSILEQRHNRIEDNLAMAQNLKRESEVDAESYETAIFEAREQARTSTQLAIKEMSEESQRRQSELNDRLVSEVKSAEERKSDFNGVDLDTEAARLMEQQQAYQAIARVLTTARELLDTLLRSM